MTAEQNSNHIQIPPDIAAEMTPAVKAFVLTLMARIEQLEAQILSLSAQVLKLSPRNSSLPPSTEHPHAKPVGKPKTKNRKEAKAGRTKRA